MSEILDYFPGAHGSAFDHLNTGGKQVLALVVPGLLLLVISYVAIGIYRFNSTPISMNTRSAVQCSVFGFAVRTVRSD